MVCVCAGGGGRHIVRGRGAGGAVQVVQAV